MVAVPLRSVEDVLAVAVVVESVESAELWPLLSQLTSSHYLIRCVSVRLCACKCE